MSDKSVYLFAATITVRSSIKGNDITNVNPPAKEQFSKVSVQMLLIWQLKDHRFALQIVNKVKKQQPSFSYSCISSILRPLSFSPTSSIFFYSACQIKMQSKQVDCQTLYSPFYVSI